MTFINQHIVITGGSTGIGAATGTRMMHAALNVNIRSPWWAIARDEWI